jgi:hypothetical protein
LYALSELHMIEPLDDRLYDLFAPSLTVSTTPGVNVNTMAEPMLRAVVPQINKESGEIEAFFKFRDSEEEDNFFKTPDDFFNYLKLNVAAFRGDPKEIERYKAELEAKKIRIVTDEKNFRIVVQAQVNQATRLIEAQVTLTDTDPSQTKKTPQNNANNQNPGQPVDPNANPDENAPEAGMKITSMRIL